MKVEIVSYYGKLFSKNNAFSLTVTTKTWEITILENHIPLISVLVPCVVEVEYGENEQKYKEHFAIGWGIVHVTHEGNVKVLVDMLVGVDEVDFTKAEKAKEEALALMERYKHAHDKEDLEKFIEAEDMLFRSLAQIKLKKYMQ